MLANIFHIAMAWKTIALNKDFFYKQPHLEKYVIEQIKISLRRSI